MAWATALPPTDAPGPHVPPASESPRERRRRYRRAWRAGTPSHRPPWWPQDEAWPPAGRRPPHVLRALGCLFVLFAIVAAIGLVATAFTLHGHIFFVRPLIMLVLVVVVIAAIGGSLGVRRLSGPLTDLLEASRRVQGGDYTARVRERQMGPRLLREVLGTFNRMAEHLETDEQRRRQLLADVGHELRTPLAVMQGGIEAMIDGVHPRDEAHLAVLLDETRLLARLVDDLRTVTLAEAGTLALHREPTDLGILVTEVAEAFQPQARAASVDLVVDAAEDLPLADVDPVRVREVLENLLSNALRYAPAGTAVRLTAHLAPADGAGAPQRVAFEVADAGPGIAPELLPRIFERLVKSDRSPGSGLGLAIAKGLVEAHGGEIEATNAAEAGAAGATGTRIRFTLPVETPPIG